MVLLYSVYNEVSHHHFNCNVRVDCSDKEIGDALDKAINHPESIHVRQMILSQTASFLFHDLGKLGYVFEYSTRRSIPIFLNVAKIHDDSIARKYLEYLRLQDSDVRNVLYENIVDNLCVPNDKELVRQLQMLIRVGFVIAELSEHQAEYIIYPVIRLLCYDDFVQCTNQRIGRCTDWLKRSKWFKVSLLDHSIQNPDGRVFDAMLDALVDIEPNSDLQYLHNPNPRSLTKLIKFALSRKCTKGWDLSRRLRTSLRFHAFESIALLGQFRDPAFIDMMLKMRSIQLNSHYPTREEFPELDRRADIVITCLKGKLPNVLVDLVLQYLV